MSKVEIEYEGKKLSINCDENESMRKILTKFADNNSVDINSLIFLYSGNLINLDLTFAQICNQEDRKTKNIIIIANKLEKSMEDKDKILNEFQFPICVNCGENIKIDFCD